MNLSPRQRLWLILVGSVLALIVLGMALQAINSLRWQLSLLMGGGLADLLLVVLALALGVAVVPLLMPWISALRRRQPAKIPAAESPIAPGDRHEAAERQLQAMTDQASAVHSS